MAHRTRSKARTTSAALSAGAPCRGSIWPTAPSATGRSVTRRTTVTSTRTRSSGPRTGCASTSTAGCTTCTASSSTGRSRAALSCLRHSRPRMAPARSSRRTRGRPGRTGTRRLSTSASTSSLTSSSAARMAGSQTARAASRGSISLAVRPYLAFPASPADLSCQTLCATLRRLRARGTRRGQAATRSTTVRSLSTA
jgi:hypothetical protein